MGERVRLPVVHERAIRHVDDETWARIKAQHAQWQVERPGLRMSDTLLMLLGFGLEHAAQVWDDARAACAAALKRSHTP